MKITGNMWNAFVEATEEGMSFESFTKGFEAALAAAPTPPAPSRTEFERLIKAQSPNAQLDLAENGEYIVPVIQTMWEGYCMAMTAAQQAEPHSWIACSVGVEKPIRELRVNCRAQMEMYRELGWTITPLYTHSTPPAQEDEPVAEVKLIRGLTKVVAIVDYSELTPGSLLYTRPANDKLRRGALEGNGRYGAAHE